MAPPAFDQVARLPAAGDNVAIATRRLEAGTQVQWNGAELRLDHTVMEGHRFAAAPVARGETLRSWGLPFGVALADIAPGAYVCNRGMLEALAGRRLDFSLPAAPNFEDRTQTYRLDPATFRPGTQVARHQGSLTFTGYDRGRRGVGTRNFLVVLGTTSRTAALARLLAARLQAAAAAHAHVDGVVAVAHTEGGSRQRPNNEAFLLRALAGFAVHPNVAGVLALDYGGEAVPNRRLRAFLEEGGYPLEEVRHDFVSIDGDLEAALARGEGILRAWLPAAEAVRRTACSVEHLKVALQCGGSDAFSGVSGNPLAAWVAREVIRWGGSANLAETDELIGAEPYVLANVRDQDTAQRFLDTVARFVERVGWHGVTAEGNPSGGNKYRGLYNIALKSIGAAMKRHPEVRLDQVIGYGEPMVAPGYYFMDSPGNDLESIAGQVAAGCNLIFFVTGNGSVTNFPFVPTIKILTTTGRFELLSRDMDVNAGQFLDGTSMEELGRRTFELALAVAGGQQTRGEAAGHSQVSIWRDWPQSGPEALESLRREPSAAGRPVALPAAAAPPRRFV
ncbi:MAG: UxaA family hydrolase, partial [Gemmatimonadota bacterium]